MRASEGMCEYSDEDQTSYVNGVQSIYNLTTYTMPPHPEIKIHRVLCIRFITHNL